MCFTSAQNLLDQLSYIYALCPFLFYVSYSNVKQSAILGSFEASSVIRNKIAGIFHMLLSSGLV